jgi:hypothetical protein
MTCWMPPRLQNDHFRVPSAGLAGSAPAAPNGGSARGCPAGFRPPRPDHPAADLSQQRIKRRAILGGLIYEYQRAA